MKRLIRFTVLCGLLFSACSKDDGSGDIVWDFWNYNMVFTVSDTADRDLLDPAVAGNILDNDIRVCYKEAEYLLSDEYCALERGQLALRHGYDEVSARYVLAFGQFSPTDQYRGQTFTVDWGDGTSNEVPSTAT